MMKWRAAIWVMVGITLLGFGVAGIVMNDHIGSRDVFDIVLGAIVLVNALVGKSAK